MAAQIASFAESWEIRQLLDVSKEHRDAALESARVFDGKVVGLDNFARLQVSTVFAALAIEAALNDFAQAHCLFVPVPYLQTFFAEVTNQFLWAKFDKKIDVLLKCWDCPFPDGLIKDVRRLIETRNRVVHKKSRFKADDKRSHGIQSMTNTSLSGQELRHMMRHYEIAEEFLQRFWLPGDAQLRQGLTDGEQLTWQLPAQ